MKRIQFLSVILTFTVAGTMVARAAWPEFRGPTGDGRVSAAGELKAGRTSPPLERNQQRQVENGNPLCRLVHSRGHGRPGLAYHRHARWP